MFLDHNVKVVLHSVKSVVVSLNIAFKRRFSYHILNFCYYSEYQLKHFYAMFTFVG